MFELAKKVVAGLMLVLVVLVLAVPAPAGDCVARSRTACYSTTYTPVYQAPTYYQTPYHDYAVKVVEVPVAPNYYYDSSSAYRDTLLADAIAFRILSMQNGQTRQVPLQQQQPATDPQPTPQPQQLLRPAQAPAPTVQTVVDPKTQALVDSKCIKCHNGPMGKAGVDLSNLATTPPGVRWAAQSLAASGEMPQGGKPVTDDEVKLLYDWARSTSRIARSPSLQAPPKE